MASAQRLRPIELATPDTSILCRICSFRKERGPAGSADLACFLNGQSNRDGRTSQDDRHGLSDYCTPTGPTLRASQASNLRLDLHAIRNQHEMKADG